MSLGKHPVRSDFGSAGTVHRVNPLVHRPGYRHQFPIGTSGLVVGDGEFLVIAGPCSVENAGYVAIAEAVADAGASMLRGGAWKPRTSPHSFQGLGADALEILVAARASTGLPFVTELLDPRHVAEAAALTDLLQVGARNMSNAVLLREVGRSGVPVLLKRGFGATVEELVRAAEYLLAEGTEDVILVERGIRTFEDSTRFTLDISAVPVLRSLTHLPIIVDPSHAAGHAAFVSDLARAAAAVGADGIMVEVHVDPTIAISDGAQTLDVPAFRALVESLDPILAAVGKRRSRSGNAIAPV
ncbi:MAG: 3-deoxy-7-phosphoheptulonate synthase [Thermoleophilia bacterium]|nr:3-deoxy-7-phosphoheptulonate synthase [Thermoleophilia bacterium]